MGNRAYLLKMIDRINQLEIVSKYLCRYVDINNDDFLSLIKDIKQNGVTYDATEDVLDYLPDKYRNSKHSITVYDNRIIYGVFSNIKDDVAYVYVDHSFFRDIQIFYEKTNDEIVSNLIGDLSKINFTTTNFNFADYSKTVSKFMLQDG